MWLSTKLSPQVLTILNQKQSTEMILNSINFIDKNDWNRGKTIWLFDFSLRNKDCFCESHELKHSNTICTFGTEFVHIYSHISFLQAFFLSEKCNTCNIDFSSKSTDPKSYLYLMKYKEKVVLNILEPSFCHLCLQVLDKKCNFIESDPCWLICEIIGTLNLEYDDLPLKIQLNNRNYKLLCCTFNNNKNHFLGVFHFNDSYYLVDDTNVKATRMIIEQIKHKIVTCFYYLEN